MIVRILNVLYVKSTRVIRNCKKNRVAIFVGLLTNLCFCQIKSFSINIRLLLSAPFIAFGSFCVSYFIFYQKMPTNLIQILKEPIKFDNAFRIVLYAVFEEILFRGIIHDYLLTRIESGIIVIVISTLVFVMFHLTKKRGFCYIIDILFFSFLITLIFHFLKDLLSTIVIHTIRNILVEKHNFNRIKNSRDDKLRLRYH